MCERERETDRQTDKQTETEREGEGERKSATANLISTGRNTGIMAVDKQEAISDRNEERRVDRQTEQN